MTYLDLIRDADRKLDKGDITLGEYEKMIEPLNREIDHTADISKKVDGGCISRQAAIDAIDECFKKVVRAGNMSAYEYDSAYAQGEIDAYVAAIDTLKTLTPVQLEPKWIPCSERLPEDYEDVLVWFEYFRYGDYNRLYQTHGIGDYSSEYDSWMINHESGWRKLRVFAWMPLPEPYREERTEE